jgi:putative LysE/RhtB family amino acid efflux pump
VAVGSFSWVSILAGGVALARRALGPRAIRVVDVLAGLGLVSFGGALLYASAHDR